MTSSRPPNSIRRSGRRDKAYQWAERRSLETYPKIGAAQLVEVRETVQEVIVPVFVQEERKAPPNAALFAEIAAERILAYGCRPPAGSLVSQAIECYGVR